MISLKEYIKKALNESKNAKGDIVYKNVDITQIQYTIWQEPDKKVTKLKNNAAYQKIECQWRDKEENIYIDFLLGFKDGSWRLWCGKPGSSTYDDEPYCTLDTEDFNDAIVKSLPKIDEIIGKVKEDPENYIQFYKAPADIDTAGGGEDEGDDGGGL